MSLPTDYPENALQAAADIALGMAYWTMEGYIAEKEGDKVIARLDDAFDKYFDTNSDDMEATLSYPKDGYEAASMIADGLAFATEQDMISFADGIAITLWLDRKTRGYFMGGDDG